MGGSAPLDDLRGARAVLAHAPWEGRERDAPLVVLLAGCRHGAGVESLQAMRAAELPGARAVLAEAYDPELRSALIERGVLPLQLPPGAGVGSPGLTDRHFLDVQELDAVEPDGYAVVRATSEDGAERIEFPARVRLEDEGELRRLLDRAAAARSG